VKCAIIHVYEGSNITVVCTVVELGCEDIQVLPNGLAFISSVSSSFHAN